MDCHCRFWRPSPESARDTQRREPSMLLGNWRSQGSAFRRGASRLVVQRRPWIPAAKDAAYMPPQSGGLLLLRLADDPAMGLVDQLGQQQVILPEAVRLLPLLALLVRAADGHAVPG